jgi:signal transduction histidine kinase/response regulator RpfG family c-di-GMP phosphodiesterase
MALTRDRNSATARRPESAAKADPPFLAGGGEMGALIREHDWARSRIGAPETWSQSLKMMVSFLLANRFPLLLWWGADYISIYNDAYRPILGAKHPQMLGVPCRECWSEIWHILKPLIDSPFQGGAATWMDDLELEVRRHGFTEESHFTVAYSPVPDETAPRGIGGVLATVHEITEKVIGERRIAALHELGARSAEAKSAEEACLAASEMLAKSPKDVPFALIYLLEHEGKAARLVATTGVPETEAVAPSHVRLTDEASEDCPWPLAEAVRTEALVAIDDLTTRLARVPPGPWSDPPHCAVVIPIRSNTAHHLAGLLVVGVSSRLQLNEQYHSFFELVAAQIATAIANARAYEEERKRAEALAEIDRAKTAFFSNVSHEFRTPLTLMLGPIEEAAANPAVPAQMRAQLQVAQRNALRLQKLVNSLLDFSRIEAGRVQACYEPTDFAASTSDLASNFRSAIERAGVALEVDCQTLDQPVHLDREMWEKIVLNLLSNAFKFTFRGTITVRVRRQDGEAVLEVCDTGVGIPEHELSRVFERFHRVEGTPGRTQEGSGIGLALVQELVKLHGGTISAESQLGHGTTFRVAVPLGSAHLPAARIKVPRALSSTAIGARAFVEEALRWIPDADVSADLPVLGGDSPRVIADRFAPTAGARVLVADDNADMRAYLRDLLSPAYAVEAVADGQQALVAARRKRPDLILSDIMMPRLNGLELLQALRADEVLCDVPMILLSARAGEEARLEGLDAGADDYLVKPFSARELLARLGARLELVRMRRAHESRFQAFVSATSEVIYQMSPDWSELRFLQGRDFMVDTEDPSHSWLDKYIHPDDQTRVLAVIQEAVRTKSVFQLEHRVRRVDGSWGWAFSRAVPLLDAKGGILEWFGAATDITARKQADEELRQRERALAEAHEALKARTEQLREADRRKNEFLALLGHELRNPLAPIATASEALSLTPMSDPRAQLAIEVVKRQAGQLSRLVDDLLDVGRITQGRIHLRREPLELGAVIAQAVETVSPLMQEKAHELTVVSSEEPLYVNGDLTRLVQCVGNVLANAAKYTDRGGKIRVQARGEDSHAVIEVADNGSGIAPDLLPRVFDLFMQSDRTLDRAQGGLGIGLSIVKRLIDMHYGQVTARSPGLGCGATFEMRLPRVTRPRERREEPAIKAAPQRILIVDDNADAAQTMALLLESSGHVTRVSLSSQEALESAESFEPQVALLDIGLPGMNGYELAQQFRRTPQLQGVRLIALTGYGLAEDRARALAAGFDAHLVKPVDLSALERTVAAISGVQ